jgi:hypothetical protein
MIQRTIALMFSDFLGHLDFEEEEVEEEDKKEKKKILRSIEKSGTDYLVTQLRIPEERNPQPHRCKKSQNSNPCMLWFRLLPQAEHFKSEIFVKAVTCNTISDLKLSIY